ncbi:MAG: orotate phosphoribosyltransferase [Synergistales bacterium]|jgi:orotate phosphoribosyltransferase
MQEELKATTLTSMMKETGALLEGHFRLTSGLHSSHYMQCALLLSVPRYAAFAGRELATVLAPLAPQAVFAPALGGVIIGHEVARHLDLPFFFAERENGAMKLRRFPTPGPIRFVVIEDVITTGGSALEVGNLIRGTGADWVGTGCIVDRSTGKAKFPHPLFSLWQASFPTFTEAECPLCREGKPIEKPGSR